MSWVNDAPMFSTRYSAPVNLYSWHERKFPVVKKSSRSRRMVVVRLGTLLCKYLRVPLQNERCAHGCYVCGCCCRLWLSPPPAPIIQAQMRENPALLISCQNTKSLSMSKRPIIRFQLLLFRRLHPSTLRILRINQSCLGVLFPPCRRGGAQESLEFYKGIVGYKS